MEDSTTSPNLKQCIECKEWRSESDFHKSSAYRTGRMSRCKICTQKRREADRRSKGMKPLRSKIQYKNGMRRCARCEEFKPVGEFTKAKNTSDQLSSHCKACQYSRLERNRRLKGIKPAKHIVHTNGGKVCSSCEKWKPLNEYGKASKNSDGYTSKCKECKRLESRQFYASNKTRLQSRNATYRQNNRELIRERSRISEKKHRATSLVKTHRRRSLIRKLKTHFTVDDWMRSLEHFNYCCAVCGRPLKDLFGSHTASADHWIPITSPHCPGTIPKNIVPLCHGESGCNNSKSNRDPIEWLNWKFGKRRARETLKRIQAYFDSLD